MNLTIHPGLLSGTVHAIPSKSQAHRLLICAAFADRETTLICHQTNQDIEATAACLRALGAVITRTETGYLIEPVKHLPESATLDCNESGSTLRFMLPVAAALGITTTFLLKGRLPSRPMSPLWEELTRMGCTLSRPAPNKILCQGKLHCGEYIINGSVSSQFVTGLLFAMALIGGENKLTVTGRQESKPYIEMTRRALSLFGVSTENTTVSSSLPFHSPGTLLVEGDWSNGAFFLAAKTLGSCVTVDGLDPDSSQGDKVVADILSGSGETMTVDAADIPDLVPILAVVAGAQHGGVFHNIGRLRLKESDRVASVSAMLEALGAKCQSNETTLTVFPGIYHGCTIDAVNDHRIAMAAAIAATVATGDVTILGAECVNKSYPGFWEEFRRLGGQHEQYIR
ncbi:MAG: 3-phosphoshikimate 1-carboxyvinyltransferase [Oscillospiraceae bacterium]|nr:3-phosphoshikimate 1-carboxyvinyltransferase [Oscillospiraceae bacterium]